MASRSKVKQQVEDELRTLFVCPDALREQQAMLAGKGEQLFKQLSDGPSSVEAQQHFERHAHLQLPKLFGPRAPDPSPQKAAESYVQALLWSNQHKTPGFSHLLQLCKPQHHSSSTAGSQGGQHDQAAAPNKPLLCLLRRVALWYYYHVMFDPLDALLALNSSYELLFQLLTPHQQLSCMADVLLVLACPTLEDQGAHLDTPQHTATLLSMLKMAQQLALAEVELQTQQQQLAAIQQHITAQGERDQEKASHQLRRVQELERRCMEAACAAAGFLTPPSLTLLQLCRQQGTRAAAGTQGAPGQYGLWAPQYQCVTDSFQHRFGPLMTLVTQQQQFGRIDMLGSYAICKAAQQQSAACQAVGALLSQLSSLPKNQPLLLWYSLEPEQHVLQSPSHATIAALLLQQCCGALRGCSQLQLSDGQAWAADPLASLLSWVAEVIGQAAAAPSCQLQQQQGQGQDHQHGASSQQQQQQHPAEALRQVLAVLLSALQYRHAISMQEWKLQQPQQQSQAALLAALHCHCMQLLAQARDQLPAEACSLGPQPAGSSSSSSGGCGSSSSSSSVPAVAQLQLQQYAREWKRVLGQLQQELLAVVTLLGHWRHHNAFCSFEPLLLSYGFDRLFVTNLLSPLPSTDSLAAAEAADAVLAASRQWLLSQPRSALPPHQYTLLQQRTAAFKQRTRGNSSQRLQPGTAAAAAAALGRAGPSARAPSAAPAAAGAAAAVASLPGASAAASSSSGTSGSSSSATPQQRSEPQPMIVAAHHVLANINSIIQKLNAQAPNEPLEDSVGSLWRAGGWQTFGDLVMTMSLVFKMVAVVSGQGAHEREIVDGDLQLFLLQQLVKGETEGRLQRGIQVLLDRLGLQPGELPGVSRWWQHTLQIVAAYHIKKQQALEQQQQQPRRYPGTDAAATAAGPLAAAAVAAEGDEEAGSSSEDGEASSAASVLRMRGGAEGSSTGSEAEVYDSDTADYQPKEAAGGPHPTYDPSGFGPSSCSTATLPARPPAGVPDTASSSSGKGTEGGGSSSGREDLHADTQGVVTEATIEAAAAAGDIAQLWECYNRLWQPIQQIARADGVSQGARQIVHQTDADIQTFAKQRHGRLDVNDLAHVCHLLIQLTDALMSPLQQWQDAEGTTDDPEAAQAALGSGSAAGSLAGSTCEETAPEQLCSAAGQRSGVGPSIEGGSESGSGSDSGSIRLGDVVDYFAAVLGEDAASAPSQAPAEELNQRLVILWEFWQAVLDQGSAFMRQCLQQQLLLQQQQQQQDGDNAGPLPAARVFRSSAGLEPKDLRGLPFTEAAAWLQLMTTVRGLCEDDSKLYHKHQFLVHMISPLHHLVPSALKSQNGSDSLSDAGRLAFATLLLQCGSLLDGPFRAVGTADYKSWHIAHVALVDLLEGCCSKVSEWVEHSSLRGLAYEATRCLSTRKENLIPNKLAASMPDIQEDMSGVAAAVAKLPEALEGYIIDLGPVEVGFGAKEEMQDDAIISSHSELFDWVGRFDNFMRLLQHIVRVHAWLARIGRRLQGTAKRLRCARRVVLLGFRDQYLAALLPEIEAATTPVMHALTEVVSAHAELRVWMQSGLVADVWGVIQHALDLVQQQYDEQDSSIRSSRQDLLRSLHQVLFDMVSHVASASFYVPEPCLPEEATKHLAGSLSSLTAQQLIFMFSRMTDPEASLWFLLPDRHWDTRYIMERRAKGADMPLKAMPFHPSSSSAGSSSNASSSRSPGAAARSQRRVCPYLASPHALLRSDHSQRYQASEDDAAMGQVESAVRRGQLWSSEARTLRHKLQDTQAELDHMAGGRADQQLQQSMLAKRHNLRRQLHQCRILQQDMQKWCLRTAHEQPAVSPLWQRDLSQALSAEPLPSNSASSASGYTDSSSDDSSDDDSDDTDDADLQHPPGLHGEVLRFKQRQAAAAAGAAAGAGCDAEAMADRQQQRQLRRVTQHAAAYEWGPRPWHVQRARLLYMRQLQLNRAVDLQRAAQSAVAIVQDQAAALQPAEKPQASNATAAMQAQQAALSGLHISCWPTWLSLLQQHAGRGDELRSADSALAAAAAAAVMPDDALAIMWYMCRSHQELTAEPDAPSHINGPGGRLFPLQQLAGEVTPVQTSKQDVAWDLLTQARAIQQCQQHMQQLCSAGGPLLGEAVSSCLQQVQQRQGTGVSKASSAAGSSSSSTRLLLWQVLGQLKPAACSWYRAAAEYHYTRQQLKALKQFEAPLPAAAAASMLDKVAADAAALPVPESASPGLWSALTSSLASDLLLVPPSIRDLLGNDWAAGAGRLQGILGPDEAHTSSSNSSGSAVAARMLVVQYARACRRQYSNTYQASGLLWQLLAVQLLAADCDMLTELQAQSTPGVNNGLAAHTDAAVAGMMPLFAAAASVAGVHLKHSSGSSQEAGSNGSRSSSSSGGGRSGGPGCASNQRGSSGRGSSNSSCRNAGHAGCADGAPQLSLLHMTAQLGCCLPASPQDASPWLQLLSRFHALSAGMGAQHAAAVDSTRGAAWQRRGGSSSSSSSDDEHGSQFDPRLELQGRLAAMAVALQSCDVPLQPAAALLCRAVQQRYTRMENVPVLAAPLSSCCASLLPRSSSSGRGLGRLQQQQGRVQQQQLQEPQQQWVERVCFWLHADRLVQVQPHDWQGHLDGHLATAPQDASHSNGNGVQQVQADDRPSQQQVHLLCDLACDWCGGALPSKASHATAASPAAGGSSSSSGKWGCPSCCAAQYCSQKCADASKAVHNANCWRLQSLAADGVCWQQPQYQQASSSSRSRSFWDLRAVE